jgi:hypothetical protein
MTPDARYVAFVSAASNLVPNDTNGIPNVFVRDLLGNETTLMSVGAQGSTNSPLTQESNAPSLTSDGRYVLFYSTADGLVPGVQTAGNLYLRDRVSDITTWVSSAAKRVLGSLASVTNAVSFNAALSEDGQFVAYEAIAFPRGTPAAILRYNLQTGLTELIDTNAATFGGNYAGIQDLGMTPDGRFVAYVANAVDTSGSTTAIRVWDAHSGASVLASDDLNNGAVFGVLSDSPAISDDGRFVAFLSDAPDLVTNEVSGDFHFYLRDLQSSTTTLIDADANGVGSLVDPIGGPVMSADGRLIAFDSWDGGLVPGDRNHAYDVFLRDVNLSEVELISAHDPALASFTPNGPSFCPSLGLSSNAQFVAFWSEADDIIANDTNEQRDVFVRDMIAGTNLLVSVNTNGVVANGFSTDPTISADGRFVAFTSGANDLAAGDRNIAQDVFVRDLQAGTTVLASVNAAGTGSANSDSYSPTLAVDGQSVLFRSRAGNLSSAVILVGTENLFWRDLRSNRTYALTTNGFSGASMTSDGTLVAYTASSSRLLQTSDRLFLWSSQSNAFVYSLSGAGFSSVGISSDGHWLAYVTNDSSIKRLIGVDRVLNTNFPIASWVSSSPSAFRFDPGNRFLAYLATTSATSAVTQVYLFDFQTGSNRLITQSYDGVSPGNDNSDSIDISYGGRFIAYRSAASNLVPGDTNGVPDVFLYDSLSGATTLVSASRFGNASANNRSLTPVFSADGRTLVFTSWASDLLPNDYNNSADVFTLDLSASVPAPDFSLTAWPGTSRTASTWLSWPVVIGKSYRAQYKHSLDDPAWQDLGQRISILGDRAYLEDPEQGPGHRFYRVISY